ncbi:hypothetical protein SI65_09058 [Aspergillus cristatus]|uniref:Uncharacterized protein n=1 Tax=Aspergillus cristatus TaxID=573508 RepID=A0A1E3B3B8_ASPCR|nr:hypothetical protein SI65_09058 [Aspergillus cristatus]
MYHKEKGYIFLPDPEDEDKQRHSYINDLIDSCIFGFSTELYHTFYEEYQPREGTRPSCLDQNMRNQSVIFEALGQLNPSRESEDENEGQKKDRTIFYHCRSSKAALASWKKGPETKTTEDERYWSRHTKSARWVCGEVLGVEL